MVLEKSKKIGSDFIKDIANVSKDQYEKIKKDYDHEKSIRDKQEKLNALDEALYQKIDEIDRKESQLALLKERVEDMKKIMANPNMQIDTTIKKVVKFSDTRKNFTESIKREILKRQNYNCKNCGTLLTTVDFDHIDGDNSNNSKDNCQALCTACHRKKSASQRSKS